MCFVGNGYGHGDSYMFCCALLGVVCVWIVLMCRSLQVLSFKIVCVSVLVQVQVTVRVNKLKQVSLLTAQVKLAGEAVDWHQGVLIAGKGNSN